jgi:hypothetical protein
MWRVKICAIFQIHLVFINIDVSLMGVKQSSDIAQENMEPFLSDLDNVEIYMMWVIYWTLFYIVYRQMVLQLI